MLELFTAEKVWALAVEEREEAHQWMFALQLVQEGRVEDFQDMLTVHSDLANIQEGRKGAPPVCFLRDLLYLPF